LFRRRRRGRWLVRRKKTAGRCATGKAYDQHCDEQSCHVRLPVCFGIAPVAALCRALALALELERDLHFRPIGFDLSVLQHHVLLDDLRDPEVAQGFVRHIQQIESIEADRA